MADRVDNLGEDIHIVMVGKYTGLTDSYLSCHQEFTTRSIRCQQKFDDRLIGGKQSRG